MEGVKNEAKLIPHIDYDMCTGQGVCVEACPENIFEIRNLSQVEFCEDTKTSGVCPEPEFAAKDRRSYPVNIDDCTACEDCVKQCPEKAITLIDKKCEE